MFDKKKKKERFDIYLKMKEFLLIIKRKFKKKKNQSRNTFSVKCIPLTLKEQLWLYFTKQSGVMFRKTNKQIDLILHDASYNKHN